MNTVKAAMITSSISRNAGGVALALKMLSSSLLNSGYSIKVFAGEDEYSDHDSMDWGGVPLSISSVKGPASFGYQSTLIHDLLEYSPNLLHVHGLWMYPSVAALHFAGKIKYITSPHGMLDVWALQNSSWKKKIAGFMYENKYLSNASCIHALCEGEYNAIRSYGLKNPVAVIPNAVSPQSLDICVLGSPWLQDFPASRHLLLYLGRLHPKKGLVALIHAWSIAVSQVDSEYLHWDLVIAGWAEGSHEIELQQLSVELNVCNTVHFVGPQFGSAKESLLQRADAFVLPSKSEGLPMAILEAWSFGLPVLMTPACNLPEGFKAEAAWSIEPESSSIAEALLKLFKTPNEELTQIGRNGFDLVNSEFSWPTVSGNMAKVYNWIAGYNSMPNFVRLD